MLNEVDNIVVVYRGGASSLYYYLLILLPIILVICTMHVDASTEFLVHRMAQFDVNGLNYGCRLSSLSLEAKTLHTWKTTRHCVVTRLEDLKISDFQDIRQNAGGLIIQLPKNFSHLTMPEKKKICALEQEMLMHSISIPVYFSHYNDKLENIIMDITYQSTTMPSHQNTHTNNNKNKNDNNNSNNNNNNMEGKRLKRTALSEMFSYISGNGYQVVISGGSHAIDKKAKIPIIQGELRPHKYINLGNSADVNKLSTIIITTSLKTFSLYHEYPLNMDAATLLSLVDIFSKYYNTLNISPKYRLIFVITESGSLLNYQGTKKWLDDNQFQNVEFVLCLDTIVHPIIDTTSTDNNKKLYLHVSKPPKENSPSNNFVKYMRTIAATSYNITIEGIHKKINLAEKQLLWEHERFCMKRLPAFTLSSLASPKDARRNTMFSEFDVIKNAEIHLQIIVKALLAYMYKSPLLNTTSNGTYEILTKEHINGSLLQAYTNVKSALHNNDLQNALQKYLQNVKLTYDKPDTRDPDFMLYEGHDAILHFYSVKPAIFDLFLTLIIAIHSTLVYIVIKFFPLLYQIVCNVLPHSTFNMLVFNNVRQKFKSN